ncbi:unnamed protein product, partial [Closterium sp. NIES-53]
VGPFPRAHRTFRPAWPCKNFSCPPAQRAALPMRALLPCCMRTLLPCPHALLPCLAAAPPCLPARRALLQPARRALLQPAHRALLPPASRPVAAHALRPTAARASRPAARTSHPAAPRVATCCSPRVAPHCCPAPPCPRALCLRHAPCPATAPYPATAPHTLPCLRHAPAPCPARASTLPCLRHMPFPTSAPRPLPCLRHAPCPVCATRPALPPRHVPCPTCATRQRPALHALAPCPAHASALPAPTPYTVRASAALHIAQRCLALPGCHHSCPARCPALTCPACSRCLRAPALPRAYRQLLLPPAHAPTVRQPSAQESLSPQQLCEWAIWRGSPGGGASRARQRKPLSPQQRHEWAIWWGATIGGTCESSPAGSAASGRGGFRGTRTGGVEAPGGVEATSLRACDSASAEAEPEEALYTFTLDSDVSRCFFRDSTAVTLLTVPVPVTLAEPSGGPVVARGATVLPCPAAPSGLLTGLHLPSFAKNLVATSVLQDQWVTVTQPGGELVAICTNSHTGEHLATFTQRPGFGLYTLTTESALVAESGQHHRLGHPSLPRLHGMHSCLLVSGLSRSLPPLQRSLALPCLPCVEGRQHAAPHSSSFPPTTAPLQTLHMDVWSPARVTRQGGEHYFLLVVDDNTCYTMDLPVLRLHSDRGGEFFFPLIEDFCGAECIPNLLPRVSHPETSPTLRWTGEVGDASAFRVWGSLSLVRDLLAGKLSPHTLRCVFLGFPTDAPPCLLPTLWPLAAQRAWRSLLVFRLDRLHRLCGPSLWTLVLLEVVTLGVRTLGVLALGVLRVLRVQGVLEVLLLEALQVEVLVVLVLVVQVLVVLVLVVLVHVSRRLSRRSGFASGLSVGAALVVALGVLELQVLEVLTLEVLVLVFLELAVLEVQVLEAQEPLSPERLRKWAVHWGSPGGGAGRVGAAGSRGAGPGGTSASLPGVGRAGGTGAGGTSATGGPRDAAAVGAAARNLGSRRQEPLSSERLREWAVHWGSLGGSAAGTGGASPRGASAGVPGGTGTGGTGAARGSGGAGPVGASAVVPRVGSTGGADTGGSTVGTGVGGASRQESLSPQQLREWAVRWGSPSGGAGGTGSGGAVATRAGGSWGATTQPQHSALCRRLSLPPATTEFPVAGTTPPLLFPPTVQTTLAALGFAPSFLRTDTSQPPFYIHVYVDDLVFPTADTKALALVKAELQERHTCTDLYLGLQITRDRARRTISLTQSHMVQQVLQHFDFSWSSPHPTPLYTGHSLSDPPSDESVEPSGPYPEPVGCLMYVMTTLGMGLVLGGPGSVVLTCHSDASWDDDQTTHRSTQGYSFSLGASSVSWRSTRSSSILRASCEAKIYARAMAAQELHWLTYLLTNLATPPLVQPPLAPAAAAPGAAAPGLRAAAPGPYSSRPWTPSSRPWPLKQPPLMQPPLDPEQPPLAPEAAAPGAAAPGPRAAAPGPCSSRPWSSRPWTPSSRSWPLKQPPLVQPPLVQPPLDPKQPPLAPEAAAPGAATPGPSRSRHWTQSSRPWPLKQPPLVQPPLDSVQLPLDPMQPPGERRPCSPGKRLLFPPLTCGTLSHTQSRCFARLSDAWRNEFGDEAELPDWVELLGQRVDIFALDYDAILTAMYALPTSADRTCHLCAAPNPSIEPAALSAGEANALGASASPALGAGEAVL